MVGATERLRPKELKARNTVLVVEDDVLVRMMIADKLRETGCAVIEAWNAHEALEVLRHDSAHVRVILSDIQMPGTMDGIALGRAIRSQYPAIKIVLTSGYLAALEWADHNGFFPKPYDPAAIIGHIKTLLA